MQPERGRGQFDFGLGGFDPDARMLFGERSDGRSHDPEEGGLERGDTHGPGQPAGGDGGDFGLGGFHSFQQEVGVPDEDAAGVGELDSAADALKQWRAGLPFQDRELLGDCTGGVAQGAGCGVQRSADMYFAQQPQPVQVDHSFRLSERTVEERRDGPE